MFTDIPLCEFASEPVWQQLATELTPTGIGLDATFGINDGDITSVTTRLLISVGWPVKAEVLQHFENPQTHTFRTYDYERNLSVGTNVHALEALDLIPDYPDRREVQSQIILMLLSSRVFNMYWIDKWHISPYYATAHVLIGLLRQGAYLVHACRHTIDWLVHNQRRDGSWGFFHVGTVEETAYTLMALLHFSRYEPVDREVLRRGAVYLADHYHGDQNDYAELWIGKCLYAPYDIVRSAILAALILYENTFGSVA